MHPIFEHRPSFAGFKTRALELDGSGPPVLLLHGFADSADTWRYVLDHMRRAERRALAVDLPGFGDAERLDRDEPILPQLDRFVAAASRQLGREHAVIVCGNSLGGALALRAAQSEKLPIEGVVPVAPAGLDMAGWLAIMEGEPLVRMLLRTPVPVPRSAVQAAVARVYRTLAFADPGGVDARAISAFAGHFRSRRDVVRIWATGRRLLPELAEPFALEKIRCPVLLVWGDRDRLVYSAGAERVLASVPDATLEVIESCGHCPQIEVPDRLASILLDFPAALAKAA